MHAHKKMVGLVTALVALALAGYGYFLASPRWPDTRLGALCGVGAICVVVLVAWRLMPAWWRSHCEEQSASRAHRRYTRAMLPAMGVYVVVLLCSTTVLKRTDLPDWLRATTALLPVLPVALVMRAMIRYLREIDELQRRIETEAICIGALAVSMLYFAGGFLQQADVIGIPAGVAMIWVFPLMMLVYGLAKFAVSRHYR